MKNSIIYIKSRCISRGLISMYYSCVKFIKQPICEQHELYMKTERAEFNRES